MEFYFDRLVRILILASF